MPALLINYELFKILIFFAYVTIIYFKVLLFLYEFILKLFRIKTKN